MASTNTYRYASGYTDGTGLIKFGARYYNPTLARFTQRDPSGQASMKGRGQAVTTLGNDAAYTYRS